MGNEEKKTNKSLAANSIFYLIYNVLNVIFPLITAIYVARILLPSSIGEVEVARNFAQYFVILAFLGIPTYGLREISKVRNNKDELNKVYSELLVINAISTIIFLSLYIVLIFVIPEYRNNYHLFLIAGVSIALNFINNSWLYEGLEKFGFISIRNLIFKVVSFVLLILFVRGQDDVINYAVITVVGTAGNYFLNIVNSGKYVHFSFKNLNLKRHIKSIIFLVVVNLAIEIYSLVDVTMLGFMCPEENVAYYSYGSKIYKIVLQIVNTFTMVLVPRISLYYKEGRLDEFNILISKTLTVILVLSLPMIVGIWFVSDYLIVAIYGSAYVSSASVLKVLSFILVISPVGYLLGSRVMLVTCNEKKMVMPVISGAIVNIILNYFLIQLWAEHGAAVASLISEVVVMVIYLFLGKKFIKLDYKYLFNECWKILIALVLMVGLLIGCYFLIKNEIIRTITQIILAIFIYFVALIVLKENIVYNYTKRIVYRMFGKWKKKR